MLLLGIGRGGWCVWCVTCGEQQAAAGGSPVGTATEASAAQRARNDPRRRPEGTLARAQNFGASATVIWLRAKSAAALIRVAGTVLDRAKRRAVSSGCGRSVAKLVTLEVSRTRSLQGLKPYTSPSLLLEFV